MHIFEKLKGVIQTYQCFPLLYLCQQPLLHMLPLPLGQLLKTKLCNILYSVSNEIIYTNHYHQQNLDESEVISST